VHHWCFRTVRSPTMTSIICTPLFVNLISGARFVFKTYSLSHRRFIRVILSKIILAPKPYIIKILYFYQKTTERTRVHAVMVGTKRSKIKFFYVIRVHLPFINCNYTKPLNSPLATLPPRKIYVSGGMTIVMVALCSQIAPR
jgi:hypothetical protein